MNPQDQNNQDNPDNLQDKQPAPETPAESPASSASPDPSALLQQLAEAKDKMIRMQADFDNFRKRLAREKDEAVRYANESLLESLLPVIDNFELGLAAAETAPDARTIAQGMQMVRTQIQRFLGDCGVEEIQAVGAVFDPHLHEAIAQEPSPEQAEGTILAQRRKGYKLRDRLLRPAAVVVAHTPAETPAA
ncbi:MAG: nucleotide exchange factor GrpE [Candidatus Methylacidiphilales bacterium]|nr:nucleotide exchange factor GrpE [Candidatus Methylacidiphilales bacterium]